MYQQNQSSSIKYLVLGLLGVLLIGGAIIGVVFALVNGGKTDTDSGNDTPETTSAVNIPETTDGGNSGVNKEEKTIELSESILNLEVGEKKELLAVVHPVDIDDVFTWTSMDEDVATVDDGIVTAVGVGTTSVTLEVNGKSSISSTCTINVVGDSDPTGGDDPDDPDDPSTPSTPTTPTTPTPGPGNKIIYPERVYLNRGDQIVTVGSTITVVATIHPSNSTNKTITWLSSNTSVAKVSSGGRITGVKPGKATITAKTHNGKTASLVVTVKENNPPVIPVSSVKLNQTTGKVKAGSTLKLTATVLPANATNKTLSWYSNNTNVAVVDNGKVTGRAVGTAKITVRSNNGKTATATITVEQGYVDVTGITLNKSSVSVNVGATTKLVATVLPQSANNRSVTWSSSNTSIATVNNGTIKGIKAGTATISAKTYNGKVAKSTVTVKNIEPTSITVNTKKVALAVGSTYKLTATISPSNATIKTITWSTSNSAVAKVAGGTITAVKVGSATITAKTHNGKSASVAVTVTAKAIAATGVTISPTSASINVGSSKTFTATVTPSNATTKTITWSSSNSAVATVSGGKVTGKKAGTAKITAKTANGKTATATITVKNINATSVKLNKTSASILVGGSVTLTATIAPTNTTIKTITWSSSNTAVATVSGGKVTGKKAGTAKITAKTANGKTATATITVNSINVTSVKLNKTSATITKGSSVALTTTIAPSNATTKTITWATSNANVATVSGGKVVGKAPGIVTITAKSHNGKTATAKITVMNFNRSIISSYGVFLGIDHDDGWNSSKLKQLFNYKLVVIDFQEFTKADVDKLHAKGIKVYTYLNIGSIENWRTYWKTYKKYALSNYDGWPGEKWIDVSKTEWQKFITGTLAPKLNKMGADGYFIDNADVYFHYKRDGIYKGLQTILRTVHSYGKPVLINGGDNFVTKAMKDNSYLNLFDGVNQEEVFTTNSYKTQSSSETKYLKNYLATVKAKNLKVYLLEYKANSSNLKKIKDYCSANGFGYHNAKDKDLK